MLTMPGSLIASGETISEQVRRKAPAERLFREPHDLLVDGPAPLPPIVHRDPDAISTVAVAGKKRPVMMQILRKVWQQRFGELHLEGSAVLGLLRRVVEPPHRSALDKVRAERHFSKVLDAKGSQGKQRNLERIAELGCVATDIDDSRRLISARHEGDAKVDKSCRFLQKGTLSGGRGGPGFLHRALSGISA